MPTPEPLHVAFVWHMHQPYYRSARTGAFEMPWARMHALKDYLDMVDILADYPDLHQTFNLVPSLVEQLEDYASGDFTDTYWEHTLKPAADLDPGERAFIVERMCERADHPRARSYPRYLELAHKREAHASRGRQACADAFTVPELRDLQIWFNLAWFDPRALESGALHELVSQGRDFREQDKFILAETQAAILARTLPAYRDAAARGQAELSTSPYFHPILPLLANSDSARIAAPGTLLPSRRFAHPEDAAEHVSNAVAKHQLVFGELPRGMWCSEQAVGEDVIPLLLDAGLAWTISDETVLALSLSGVIASDSPGQTSRGAERTASVRLDPEDLYRAYRLEREDKELAIVFRDHTLSDLVGFAYQSWNSRDAAADFLRRLGELRNTGQPELVTIALDGENAWEYYPRDGRDFLEYLYEGLSTDPSFRCVTVSEHLRQSPPARSLGWLHTGSWIGGDLRTWSGDHGHQAAWDLLHDARDVAAPRRRFSGDPKVEAAWRHILVAEGSDWFWWFGDHHHTDLDHVWDLDFRTRLQTVYQLLGEPIPVELFLPILEHLPSEQPAPPQGPLAPEIDGLISHPDEWRLAGYLASVPASTMQPAETAAIAEVRFGWNRGGLCLLVVPSPSTSLLGLEIEIRFARSGEGNEPVASLLLEEQGQVAVSCTRGALLAGAAVAAWKEVLEASLPIRLSALATDGAVGLVVHIGRGGLTEHVFHSASLGSLG
ncbi:MAG: hypothetical protein A2133_11100 [Actinobacteria bacterium RBG_16_64_13]|nr:MAG: hypothetical protein A2133_11100 [Actinobacteria bacterium RBG_16_64_13]